MIILWSTLVLSMHATVSQVSRGMHGLSWGCAQSAMGAPSPVLGAKPLEALPGQPGAAGSDSMDSVSGIGLEVQLQIWRPPTAPDPLETSFLFGCVSCMRAGQPAFTRAAPHAAATCSCSPVVKCYL
jgi:hypothetical protein